MSHSLPSLPRACCLLAVLGALSGCAHKPAAATDSSPPVVSVSKPVERPVTDYVDFTGRTEAPDSVDVRARVTGYLTKMPFKEGEEVKKGDVLFEIDDRPYKADLDRAKGDLERTKASLVKAQADLDIAHAVYKDNPKAISQEEIVKRQGSRDEAAGQLKAAEATLVRSQLNYDWCKVTSPINGRVSRYNLTVGNLASQDTSVLTTVVSQDPLYAYFDADENTMLRVTRLFLKSDVDVPKEKQFPVLMGLADEEGYPHAGYVDFANNVVNSSTGTITARGVFANPSNPLGRRLLRPGMFVRIRLPLGKPRPALLVSEKALGTDQGQKYLLVVDEKNVVEYRRVRVGPLQEDGLRVIEEGLKPGERVIVNGLQLVRPRMEVEVEEVPMPEVRSQESGVRGQESADRHQQAGGKGQEREKEGGA
jgi:multidrug efflux system membrane fusion protein